MPDMVTNQAGARALWWSLLHNTGHLHVVRAFGVVGARSARADVGTGAGKKPGGGFNPLSEGKGRGLGLG